MSKAMLWLVDGSHKVIEPEKALEIWNSMNGLCEPTELQAKYIPHIRDIFIPPSYRDQAKGYMEAHKHARHVVKPETIERPAVSRLKDENTLDTGLPVVHRAHTTELRPDPQEQAVENGTAWWVD